MSAPLEPAALLPHEGAARFVTRVLEHDGDRIVCEARIPEESAFVAADPEGEPSVPAFVGLEVAAQASAVLEGLCAAGAGAGPERRLGYLVRARRLGWPRPTLPVATALEVTVRREGIAGPLHLYAAEVKVRGTVRFSGTFGTFTGIGA